MTQIIILAVILYKYILRKPVIFAIFCYFDVSMITNFYLYRFKITLVFDKYSFDNMLYIYIYKPRHILKTG
jgi:hypothetical protein